MRQDEISPIGELLTFGYTLGVIIGLVDALVRPPADPPLLAMVYIALGGGLIVFSVSTKFRHWPIDID